MKPVEIVGYLSLDPVETGFHNSSSESEKEREKIEKNKKRVKITKHMEPNYARKTQPQSITKELKTGFYIKNTKMTRSLSSNKSKTRKRTSRTRSI